MASKAAEGPQSLHDSFEHVSEFIVGSTSNPGVSSMHVTSGGQVDSPVVLQGAHADCHPSSDEELVLFAHSPTKLVKTIF